ncbi:uncharacterized protein MYCGRDRAFT_86704 [Zymoseptoria tritici IPO323]|uniref:Deacetylase sirtuin-type domain-containing protein n=1 Tax=Zymoseptoria tritici (strain CBS 115943 / IPO323) TaxID=336722 RepID=F9XGE3_ZYMTI|nr:uncharacterized protein MYCGRDRAFT_86704 [Zymoseptoria tritici IPO323]EGP86281.1 hypothetical protein MYCGRDRAFT_86704 [Zymoseptoria tritici IPO323]
MSLGRDDAHDVKSFHSYLQESRSIIALVGAGLSASSGLAVFTGADGLWENQDPFSLATPEAFRSDAARVWRFYDRRRHEALQAQPNAAHFALAEASRQLPGFITMNQNIDGLSERADHPGSQLLALHGSLFEVQCTNTQSCEYWREDFTYSIVSMDSLSVEREHTPTQTQDTICPDPEISRPDCQLQGLPNCPRCNSILRPGVVWFGERLKDEVLLRIRHSFSQPEKIDLMLVIGTAAQVMPAAGYIDVARARGARLCFVNTDRNTGTGGNLQNGDWFFEGDAAVIVPILLEPVTSQGSRPHIPS